MKKLSDYEIINQKVFYKGWHILEYIQNKELSDLDIDAIKATIMDALVSENCINPIYEYLDFEKLSITTMKNDNTYEYEKYPNICGIPLWMKEKFRTKSIYITGGLPVSIFLAIPSKSRCIYDMNTAVSAFFDNCRFYQVNYTSPTRQGVNVLERPFVEIEIDGILYLVDNITRRIIRRDFFEKNYGFDIIHVLSKEKMPSDKQEIYEESVADSINMAPYLSCYYCFDDNFIKNAEAAEHYYEIEQSKVYFPDAWKDYEDYQERMNQYLNDVFFLVKKK